MRPGNWMLGTMLLLALAPAAMAGSQTTWSLSRFTWVKRVAAEPGAPANAHPASLSPEALQAALGPVQAQVEGQAIPLFAMDELQALSKALSQALALAQPGEDLVLLSTNKRGGSFMEKAVGVTARLFVREGALNLIVRDARLDFMDRYLANDTPLPEFTYGSRKAASAATLQAPQATRLRPDWLTLSLAVMPAAAATAPVAAPVVAPAPAAPLPAPASEPAGPRDAAYYEAQTLRLKALKRLRDDNLISEAEYQEKRAAILKGF